MARQLSARTIQRPQVSVRHPTNRPHEKSISRIEQLAMFMQITSEHATSSVV
jgi:hypothetical protein